MSPLTRSATSIVVAGVIAASGAGLAGCGDDPADNALQDAAQQAEDVQDQVNEQIDQQSEQLEDATSGN